MPAAVGTLFASKLVTFLATVAFNIVVAKITAKAMQKKPTRVTQKVDVSYAGALEPRRKLYGYFRAGGLDTMPAITYGLNGTRLAKLLTISDGEIESVDAVWFNNDRFPSGTYVGGSTVSAAPVNGQAYVSAHLGAASQSADSTAITVPGWSTEHRGDGVAYVFMFFDADNEVWTQGAPNVLIEGSGALVYDPRLDSSPGDDPTDPAFIAFTTNPALIAADFLQWGGDELAANIDWDDVVTCANECEESVTVPDGLGGTTTQDRYTCSVEVYKPLSQGERDETIKMLARAFMGVIWWSGNKWKMRAGAYTAPTYTLLDNDFLGESISIATAQPRSSGGIFNTVRGSYVDQNQNTQPVPFPEVSTASYVTDDGEVIHADAEFKTARSVYEAQRNAILLNRQSRRRIIIAATFRFKAWKLQLYDTVTVTCAKVGWSSQIARVIGMKLRGNFLVELQLQEIASADFTDPSTGDYLDSDNVTPPEGDDYVPNPPQNLAAQSQASAIIFTWDPPTNAPIGVLYRLYRHTSSTPFSSATQIGPDSPQTSIVVPMTDTTLYYWWVTAVDPVTLAESTQAPPSNGVPGGAASASSALGAIVNPGSATVTGYTSSLQTDEVFVTATGGTAPYTYATTFTSGGSGITINDGTTSSPYFSATGLAEGDVKSGTARIRVTDNVAATYDVYVAVTISRLYGVIVNDTTITATGAASGGGYGGAPAITTYAVADSGSVYPSPGGGSYQWKNPSATASDYDVRFTLNSGTVSSGTTGSWLQLNTARSIVATRLPAEGAGTSVTNITVEIRLHAFPFTVLDSGTLIMNRTIV